MGYKKLWKYPGKLNNVSISQKKTTWKIQEEIDGSKIIKKNIFMKYFTRIIKYKKKQNNIYRIKQD